MNELANVKTMSSTEIAELTGKRKSDVHQDIKTQILKGLYAVEDGGNFHHEQIQGLSIEFDERGYWKEVRLDKYHTDILVSGYEIKYRAAIIKRWHELEKGVTDAQQAKTVEQTDYERLAKISQAMIDMAKQYSLVGNQALLSANRATKAVTGISPMELLGITHLVAEHQDMLLTATEVGNRLKEPLAAEHRDMLLTATEVGNRLKEPLAATSVNKLLEKLGFQKGYRDYKNNLKWEVTGKGKAYSEVLDTGKRHSDGTPVKQIKWKTSVVEELQSLLDCI